MKSELTSGAILSILWLSIAGCSGGSNPPMIDTTDGPVTDEPLTESSNPPMIDMTGGPGTDEPLVESSNPPMIDTTDGPVTDEPLAESSNPPDDELPSVSNGYYLSGYSLVFPSGTVSQRQKHVLDIENQSILEYSVNANGEETLEFVREYNERGVIDVRRQFSLATGEELIRTDYEYDEFNRRVISRGFESDGPSVVNTFEFNERGAHSRRTSTNPSNGSVIIVIDYSYNNQNELSRTLLNSPSLSFSVDKTYAFGPDGVQLQTIEEEVLRIEIEYDSNGNVIAAMNYREDGALFNTRVYQYTKTDETVPNLPLHDLLYSTPFF